MNNKTVMVTGATKGIGLATLNAFIDEGYNVIVHYRSDKEIAEELAKKAQDQGLKAMAVYADLSQIEDLKLMVQKVFEEFETIDVLVNNAGTSKENYFLDITEEEFDFVNNVDWKSLFFCSQYVVKKMIEKKTEGVVVNISSNQVEGCWPRATVYAPVKSAVSKFTKNASMELAPYGIRMVAVAPGYTDIGWSADSHLREAEKLLPLGRFATTKEVADAVVYVASDKAKYMTGSTLTIDGGATLPVVACNDFVK